jgi:hypothetical protein
VSTSSGVAARSVKASNSGRPRCGPHPGHRAGGRGRPRSRPYPGRPSFACRPVILLKGAGYVLAGIRAARGRMFSEVDVLVPRVRLADVEAALMLAGWATTNPSAFDQLYFRQWMHGLPTLQHIRRQTVLDVHHAILPDTARLKPSSRKLFEAASLLNGHLEPPPVRALVRWSTVLNCARLKAGGFDFRRRLATVEDVLDRAQQRAIAGDLQPSLARLSAVTRITVRGRRCRRGRASAPPAGRGLHAVDADDDAGRRARSRRAERALDRPARPLAVWGPVRSRPPWS